MPELPEVETTRRGLEPLLVGQRIRTAVVRNHALRFRVPRRLPRLVTGTTVRALNRRGKYLLVDCGSGTLILHLGMSGRLLIVDTAAPVMAHDHFDLVLENDTVVRLRDPRRFGLVLWQPGNPLTHALLARIGPEPLSPEFNGAWLHRVTRSRGAAIKPVLMDGHVVAGVGNIYANEALFRARIHPGTRARRLSASRCALLAVKIRETLELALQAGGSSLRDYVASDGRAGYFQDQFLVYGRAGEPCFGCGTTIRQTRQGQRSTFFCPRCQRS
ncbi:MAG: bifunctional DNA-formamidopyrimidine glycosylase/DNA-(apurinic or apyrimidinic site) lyase [Betaproteobacteria bacterium]|nr:bifunctional DNA-formamidopyrimidine glycosylase/DNA-(apurinic or apyrimidinic site) lyase [Betaproteobacteria bacterium]MDH3436073.1 bifunctional DNA-formamidopyrimidine glycosylase/DNA-(apurinic or apyrimidinic site) lyase [Betaproteobacteria bacterium]